MSAVSVFSVGAPSGIDECMSVVKEGTCFDD